MTVCERRYLWSSPAPAGRGRYPSEPLDPHHQRRYWLVDGCYHGYLAITTFPATVWRDCVRAESSWVALGWVGRSQLWAGRQVDILEKRG